MKITHLKDAPAEANTDSLFTAPVSIQSPLRGSDSQMNIAYVSFPVGVRNKFHRHTTDQVLIVTEGHGVVADEEQEVQITVGDVILIPQGEKHWHGALPDSTMTHIAITPAGSKIEQLEN